MESREAKTVGDRQREAKRNAFVLCLRVAVFCVAVSDSSVMSVVILVLGSNFTHNR